LKIKACYELVVYYAIFALLLPLLLLQAVWVRLTIIKLPEATGERTGNSGKNNAIKLLILGDSAAAGVGVNQQKQALAGQLPLLLTKQHPINWQLIASSGLTSTDIINELALLPAQKFDLVLISVGVNDVTHFTRQAQWTENINTLITILSSKFSADKVLFSSVPPMHLFTALPQPLRWWLGLRATKLNTLMAAVLANQHQGANNKCSVLTVDIPFNPEFLATDGMHPSTLAYNVWAKQAAEQFSILLTANEHKNERQSQLK
jgi:lysophospholipase L1-like esterase|tara:strand:- start:22463 stop:23248 length:786 start_codon:yes stop_codon:yes gene_type:complete